jgi:transcriptional regulator with XRE-family HTH domain
MQEFFLSVKREVIAVSDSVERPPRALRLFQARSAMETRLGRRVPQTEVGRVLGVHGVTVGGWESGKSEPNYDMMAKLATFYGVSVAWLAWGIIEGELRAGDPTAPTSVPVIGTANESDVPPAPVQAPRPHKEISRHQKAPLHPIRRRPDEGKGRKGA